MMKGYDVNDKQRFQSENPTLYIQLLMLMSK